VTNKLTILTLLFGLTFFVSCAQSSKPKLADKFFKFLNDYQTDSLQALVADNFQLKRTYATYANDKKSFIEKYVPTSKNFNGKYKILSKKNNGAITDFLVEDQSDYLKYLNIVYPKWKIKITVNEESKIETMLIDTTKNHQVYLTQAKVKGGMFDKWLKLKYPSETTDILFNTPGLLLQRLKEYSKK
jgi:hypothetical protein